MFHALSRSLELEGGQIYVAFARRIDLLPLRDSRCRSLPPGQRPSGCRGGKAAADACEGGPDPASSGPV
jgi:hypothetical protein